VRYYKPGKGGGWEGLWEKKKKEKSLQNNLTIVPNQAITKITFLNEVT
jgi:hypothetical protein